MTNSPDMLLLLARRWKIIVVASALGLGIAIAYGVLSPPWYSSTLTVIPTQRSGEHGAAGMLAKLPVALDSTSNDVQRIQAVLNSTSVADEVIDNFKLERRYGEPYREHARKKLRKHCSTHVDRQSSVVALTCEDTEAETARAITAYFGVVANRVLARVSTSTARDERRFLEAQVVKARSDVDEASRKLRDFQETHKIVDLPEQSKAAISAMAAIKGELLSKQLELSYLTTFSASTESSVRQLQRQITILESKLLQLESAPDTSIATGSSAGSNEQDFFPRALNVPALTYELEQLLREQKIKETVFFLMTQRFEMAKVDEARDTSTFQVLDEPRAATYRSRPDRTRIAIVGLVLGIIAGSALVLVPVWWRRRQEAVT